MVFYLEHRRSFGEALKPILGSDNIHFCGDAWRETGKCIRQLRLERRRRAAYHGASETASHEYSGRTSHPFPSGRYGACRGFRIRLSFRFSLQDKKAEKTTKGSRKLVKCLVCGEIFDSSLEVCPVCGVGRENFVPVEEKETTYRKDGDEFYVILGNGTARTECGESSPGAG